MDRSCHAQLLADAAGPTVKIDHPNAKLTHSQVGTEIGGWFSFQPMFDWIVQPGTRPARLMGTASRRLVGGG